MSRSVPNSSFAFLPMADYFAEITQAISKAHAPNRVLVSTMVLDPRVPEIQALMDALAAAAKRGAIVDLAFDAQSYMLDPVPRKFRIGYIANSPEKFTRGYYEQVLLTREKMHESGVRVHVTNIPEHIIGSPFHGRSHIKICVVNDTVYIGGCNLSKPHDIDGMIRISNAKTADLTYAALLPAYQSDAVGYAFGYKDQSFTIDPQTTLLIDAGKKQQSIIYENALHIIENAHKTIFMTCQFFPSGKTANALAAAYKRGVDVRLVFNSPHKHGGFVFHYGHVAAQQLAAMKLPNALFAHELPMNAPYIHAKILTNETSGMIGSHNYVSQGVRFGTAEIAILRHNPAFAQYLVHNIEKLIDQYAPRR